MPTDRHLQVAEIPDFAPGLWTAGGTLLMPSTGWQTMTDCRPEPGGGLRAAFKPTAISLTGITNLSTSSLLAFITFGGQGSGGNDEYYMWTKDTTAHLIRVWRWDGAAWNAVTTHDYGAAATVQPYVQVDTFTKSTGVNFIEYIIWQNGTDAAIEGLWEINRTTHAAASVDIGVTLTALCVMDDKIITASGATLYYSLSGSSTFNHGSQFLSVQASRWEPLINGLVYIAPSDLLCSTNGTVWSRVQGDITTSPIVRSMSDAHRPSFLQNLNLSDAGILFYEAGVGIVATGDGNSFQTISTQIDPSAFGSGDISQVGNFILTMNGLVYDVRTHSWFQSSLLAASAYQYCDHRDQIIMAGTTGNNFSVYRVDPSEATRFNVFTAKTAPIRSQDGRRVKIRQVQVAAVGYHASDTVAVTVNGTTKTYTFTGAGRQIIPFLFHEEAEMLDVQVVSTADSSSHEAPTIEALRIGKGVGHRSL